MKVQDIYEGINQHAKLAKAIEEWHSKDRSNVGCVDATNFICKRVSSFKQKRETFYTKNGESYDHVVAHNGKISIDLAPHAAKPSKSTAPPKWDKSRYK